MSSQLIKRDLIILGCADLIILLASTVYWWISDKRAAIDFQDALFLSSTVFMCLGLLIAITNTSRRHYYKHIKQKYKTGNHDDTKYEQEREGRLRNTRIGAVISVSGIVGIVLCALMVYI